MIDYVRLLLSWGAVLCLLLVVIGCDEGSIVASDPHSPYIPSNPTPSDGDDLQPTMATLQWEAGHPDGSQLVYDIYLGTTRRPELRTQCCLENQLTAVFLEADQTYYWRVVAWDLDSNSSSSPLWTFRTEAVSPNFTYPHAVGNRWEYAGQYYYRDSRPFPTSSGINLDTIGIGTLTEIVSYDTLDEGRLAAYQIRTDFLMDIDNPRYSSSTVAWFNDYPDGRYIVAEDQWFGLGLDWLEPILNTPGIDLPGLSEAGLGSAPLSGASDYAYPLDPPHKDLAYPMKIDRRWTYSSWPSQEWPRTDKIITGRKNITVPAGSFDCWEIKWLYLVREDGSYHSTISHTDYVADIGLVASYYLVEDLIWTDELHPEGSGIADLVQYLELIDYDLK